MRMPQTHIYRHYRIGICTDPKRLKKPREAARKRWDLQDRVLYLTPCFAQTRTTSMSCAQGCQGELSDGTELQLDFGPGVYVSMRGDHFSLVGLTVS